MLWSSGPAKAITAYIKRKITREELWYSVLRRMALRVQFSKNLGALMEKMRWETRADNSSALHQMKNGNLFHVQRVCHIFSLKIIYWKTRYIPITFFLADWFLLQLKPQPAGSAWKTFLFHSSLLEGIRDPNSATEKATSVVGAAHGAMYPSRSRTNGQVIKWTASLT